MNTLKYSLEYKCYPIWEYDEAGELIDNDIPAELREDKELDSLLLKVQEIFDGMFVDTPKEFSSHGFKTEDERHDFLSLLMSSAELLRNRYGNSYHIDCKYNEESFPISSSNLSTSHRITHLII